MLTLHYLELIFEVERRKVSPPSLETVCEDLFSLPFLAPFILKHLCDSARISKVPAAPAAKPSR